MDFETLAKMVADYKDMDIGDVHPDTTFEELGLDSLDTVELLMAFEEKLGITIEPDESIKTMKDLADYIDGIQS